MLHVSFINRVINIRHGYLVQGTKNTHGAKYVSFGFLKINLYTFIQFIYIYTHKPKFVSGKTY